MSRFRKLSHSIWHCQYHIVWVPKYRFRVLTGAIGEAAQTGIHAVCGFSGCEVVELNVQPDHVHLVVMIPPKVAISVLILMPLMKKCSGAGTYPATVPRNSTELPGLARPLSST